MGTDQGKTSNLNALGVVSKLLDTPVPKVGLTTFRPPYTPTTFGIFAGLARGDQFDPIRRTAIHAWAERRGAVFEDVGLWKRARYFPIGREDMHSAVARECAGTRNSVGIFDASTLGKIEVVGNDAAEFILLGGDTVQVCTGVMKFGYELVKPLCEQLLAFMDKHKFQTPADFKGKSLDYFTTHADLVKRQAERKAAQKAAGAGKLVKSDAEWHGDHFVKQSDALAGGQS